MRKGGHWFALDATERLGIVTGFERPLSGRSDVSHHYSALQRQSGVVVTHVSTSSMIERNCRSPRCPGNSHASRAIRIFRSDAGEHHAVIGAKAMAVVIPAVRTRMTARRRLACAGISGTSGEAHFGTGCCAGKSVMLKRYVMEPRLLFSERAENNL
ncbi:MAG: hypothetical protein U0Y68_14350 [Blastocatellia bacterium]